MQYALDVNGIKVEATPRGRGTCELCKAVMIAKCGSQVIRHWAHESISECDPWWEPEGQWHRNLKEMFPPECREVVLPPHRADIRLQNGLVIELQSSTISTEVIAAREEHYKTMIWVFDAVAPARDGRIILNEKSKDRVSFEWSHARRSLATCKKPVYVDLGAGRILYIPRPSNATETPLRGDGITDTRDAFASRMQRYPQRAIRNWLDA